MAMRIYSLEGFSMTTGVSLPLDGALVARAFEHKAFILRMGLGEAVENRRFAEAIYREAIRSGVMERVRFQDPPGLAGAA